jgi:hypothetical protein
MAAIQTLLLLLLLLLVPVRLQSRLLAALEI